VKEKIHPKYFDDAEIICACGNVIHTGSTRKQTKVEVCSNCHPFFTGEQRMLDTTGRVDRFKQRYNIKS
jgi:large subunit ribosomal protein L31